LNDLRLWYGLEALAAVNAPPKPSDLSPSAAFEVPAAEFWTNLEIVSTPRAKGRDSIPVALPFRAPPLALSNEPIAPPQEVPGAGIPDWLADISPAAQAFPESVPSSPTTPASPAVSRPPTAAAAGTPDAELPSLETPAAADSTRSKRKTPEVLQTCEGLELEPPPPAPSPPPPPRHTAIATAAQPTILKPAPAPRALTVLAEKAIQESGFDPRTGQIVNPARFEKWKQEKDRPCDVAHGANNGSLMEVFRKARIAIENWVDDDKHQVLILGGEPVEWERDPALVAVLEQGAKYGDAMLQRLKTHLAFMIDNRRKYHAARAAEL
jgi:hypothetical protein